LKYPENRIVQNHDSPTVHVHGARSDAARPGGVSVSTRRAAIFDLRLQISPGFQPLDFGSAIASSDSTENNLLTAANVKINLSASVDGFIAELMKSG